VQKLARQKFRVSSYETIEKKIRFWGLTPKPEVVATDWIGGSVAPDEAYRTFRTVKKNRADRFRNGRDIEGQRNSFSAP